MGCSGSKVKEFRNEENTIREENEVTHSRQSNENEEAIFVGNYSSMDNHDIFDQFLNNPKVKKYLTYVLNQKELEDENLNEIKGIATEVIPLIDQLFKRYNIKLKIPTDTFEVDCIKYKLQCSPCTEEDLDAYLPLFLFEFWIYPKSFIRLAQLENVVFINDLTFTTPQYSQYRAGCPEYNQTYSLYYSTKERNFKYIRTVIHHEFFHYVDWMHDFSYEDDEFRKLNQGKFQYGNGGAFEREFKKLDPNLKGFLNHYCTTALEEDKAEIFQYIISKPHEALNHKDEVIRRKCRHIKTFICNFDKEGFAKGSLFNDLIDFRTKYKYY